ncbi:MAG: PD-(D/E)XK nuclease family protein [bacterium]
MLRVSRGFAGCPFSHFAVYGLKLRERQEYGLDLPSLGLFTHSVLRRLTEDLLQAGRDFADLTPEETESLVTEKVEAAGAGVCQRHPGQLGSFPLPQP